MNQPSTRVPVVGAVGPTRARATSRERLRFIGIIATVVTSAVAVQLSLGALLERLLAP